MPVSSKTTKRWKNPFKKNAKDTKAVGVKPYEEKTDAFNSASTSSTATDLSGLSPTSVASDLSLSPVRYSKNAQWDMTEISPPVPVYEADQDANAKYGYEEASPNAPEEYGYGDASPDNRVKGDASPTDEAKYGYGDTTLADDNAKYGYGDATPNDNDKYGYGDATSDDKAKFGYGDTSPRVSFCRTPRRSSMKQCGAPRRASVQFGGEIQVNLPGMKNPVKRRTSIAFKETVKVKKVTPVSELTDQPEALWFQDEEYNRMRQKSFALVDRVDNGKVPGGDKKYCVRGLEKLMAKNRDGVRQRRFDAWDSVLNEQDLQRQHGNFDDDYMGNICKLSTVKSQHEAVERAQQDATEIENYLMNTRKICRRLSM
jgi:hypothetical protein